MHLSVSKKVLTIAAAGLFTACIGYTVAQQKAANGITSVKAVLAKLPVDTTASQRAFTAMRESGGNVATAVAALQQSGVPFESYASVLLAEKVQPSLLATAGIAAGASPAAVVGSIVTVSPSSATAVVASVVTAISSGYNLTTPNAAQEAIISATVSSAVRAVPGAAVQIVQAAATAAPSLTPYVVQSAISVVPSLTLPITSAGVTAVASSKLQPSLAQLVVGRTMLFAVANNTALAPQLAATAIAAFPASTEVVVQRAVAAAPSDVDAQIISLSAATAAKFNVNPSVVANAARDGGAGTALINNSIALSSTPSVQQMAETVRLTAVRSSGAQQTAQQIVDAAQASAIAQADVNQTTAAQSPVAEQNAQQPLTEPGAGPTVTITNTTTTPTSSTADPSSNGTVISRS